MVRRPLVHAALEWDTLSADGWQQKFSELAGKGLEPYLVAATGPANAPLIAAVFRPMTAIPLTRHGINADQFAKLNYQAWCDGLIPASVDAYGSPGDVRFIATWHPNTRRVA